MRILHSEKIMLVARLMEVLQNKTIIRFKLDTLIPQLVADGSVITGMYLKDKYTSNIVPIDECLEQEIRKIVKDHTNSQVDYDEDFGESTSYGFIKIDLATFKYDLDLRERKNLRRITKTGFLFDYDQDGE